MTSPSSVGTSTVPPSAAVTKVMGTSQDRWLPSRSKIGMLLHANLDIQIAGRAAVAARLALAVQANAIAGIDTRGHFDGQRFLLPDPALAEAGIAGIGNDLAAAFAARTGLLDGEDGLLHPHLALAVAGVAGFRGGAFGRAGALAGLALAHGGDVNLGLGAEHRLLQIQFEFVAQVCAAENLRSAALAAGKDIAEHFAENIAECFAGAEAAAAVALQARMSELIVNGALMRIAQHLVRLFAFFETVFGFRVVGIAIRMKFHREAAVGLFNVGFRRISRQVEELIVILLRHSIPLRPVP